MRHRSVLLSATLPLTLWAATFEEETLFLQTPDSEEGFLAAKEVTHLSEDETASWFIGRLEALNFSSMESRIEAFIAKVTRPTEKPSLVIDSSPPRNAILESAEGHSPLGAYYSPAGAVNGQVTWANYGRQADFLSLATQPTMTYHGKIFLMRYGPPEDPISPATKVALAEEYGATGVLLYADPADDLGETVYPWGTGMPSDATKDHTVVRTEMCPGDPHRANSHELCGMPVERIIPNITVMSIPWEEAWYLHKEMEGSTMAFKDFQGGVGMAYHFGPTKNKVKMNVTSETFERKLENVITTIPGITAGTKSEQFIVIGASRDSLARNAAGAAASTAALMEMARGFSVMQSQTGWQPARTIILASWDGSVAGQLGSTAWVESMGLDAEWAKKVVAYINIDGVYGGHLRLGASRPLQTFVKDTLEEVVDPLTGLPISFGWDRNFDAIGDRKDYAAFTNHLGILSINLGFEGSYGVRGTVYDTVYAVEMLGDGAPYLATVSQLAGLFAVRLADAAVLPLDHQGATEAMRKDVTHFWGVIRGTCGLHAKVNGVSTDVASFGRSADIAAKEAESLQEYVSKASESGNMTLLDLMQMPAIHDFNSRMMNVEKAFLGNGLPGRPWYKHVFDAPDIHGRTSVVTWPAATDAVRHTVRGNNCQLLIDALNSLQQRISLAADVLGGPVPEPEPIPEPRPSPMPPALRRVQRVTLAFAVLVGVVMAIVVYSFLRPHLLRLGFGLQNQDLVTGITAAAAAENENGNSNSNVNSVITPVSNPVSDPVSNGS